MRHILRFYNHYKWLIVAEHDRCITVCPWFPLVAPSIRIDLVVSVQLVCFCFCICFGRGCLCPPNVYSALLNASGGYITSFICLHNKWLIMAELTFGGEIKCSLFPLNVNSVSIDCDKKSVVRIYFKIKIIS